MKSLACIFLVAFVVMFAFGFKNGYESMKKTGADEDFLFSRVGLRKIGDNFYLVYPDKKDNPLYVYDFNLKAVRPFDASMFISHFNPSTKDRVSAVVESLNNTIDPAVASSLGMLSLGYSMKDFISLDKEGLRSVFGVQERVKKFLSALAGGLTGYSFGWYIGAYKWMPEPTSDSSLKIVSDTSKWQTRKEFIYKNIVLQYAESISRIKDPEVRMRAQGDLIEVVNLAAAKNEFGYSAYQFLILASHDIGDAIRQDSAKQNEWRLEDIFMLFPLLGILMFALYGVYSLVLKLLGRLKDSPSKPAS
jgi:hypothetical protein